MRLAISNIAWDVAEDQAIATLLRRFGVDAIDIAPGKYFPEPAKATDEDMARVKRWWVDQGIEITGMQALLFGTTGLNMFGSPDVQEAMLEHLAQVCRIGGATGAKKVVFGSPRNRDRAGLSDQETLDTALDFFHLLGDIALSHGVLICLEPNPACYGANFMTTSAETLEVVARLAHPSVKMQFDTGSLAINGENADAVLCDCASYIGHIHASEPDLLPLGDGGAKHLSFAEAINKYLPNSLVTIEMLATKNESHTRSVERALAVAKQYYCHDKIGVSA